MIRQLVNHPNVSPEILSQIAKTTSDIYVLTDIAKNPNTPEPILRGLFEKKDDLINLSLAWNPSIPLDLLLKLAESNNVYVLIGVTRNPRTPRALLEKLAHNTDELVRIQAQLTLKERW